MDVLDRIKKEVKNKNTSIAAVEKALNFGNGSIRKWDRRSPSCDKAEKVANYLDCSLDYLIDGKEKSITLTLDEQELLSHYKNLSDTQKGRLLERAAIMAEKAEE